MKGPDLSLEVDGATNAPASALYGTYYCSAAAMTKTASRKAKPRRLFEMTGFLWLRG